MTQDAHRESTVESTFSDETGLDDFPESAEKQGIQRIFLDATRYGEVLAEQETPVASRRSSDDITDKVKGFADLVGRDLNGPEQAISERFAKLSVNNWADAGFLGGETSAEPESYDQEDAEDRLRLMSWAESEGKQTDGEAANVQQLDVEHKLALEDPGVPPSPSSDTSEKTLSPEQIVGLLIDEFGPLAGPGEEERLLVEADGAFFQEVAILGVVHLTTHRIAFHASLLATRPDLLPEQQVLMKGPVTLHRPGLFRKKKLWLELSHDMICSFQSSKEEDRIKPLRSILLSSIIGADPEDPNHPKHLRLRFQSGQGASGGWAEFETEEAAREWRREIQGALFMYRHRRAVALTNQSDDESNGVRISVPLACIKKHENRTFLKVSVVISLELLESDNDSEVNVDLEDAPRSSSSNTHHDQETDRRSIELALIQSDDTWNSLGLLIDQAKTSLEKNKDAPQPRAVVDFGSLSFVLEDNMLSPEKGKERSIRQKLSLGEDEMWYTRSRAPCNVTSTGYFVVTPRFIGFWGKCLASASDVTYRLPISMINSATPFLRKILKFPGIKLSLEGRQDLSFDFSSVEIRDETIRRVSEAISAEHDRISGIASPTTTLCNSPRSSSSSDTQFFPHPTRAMSLSSTDPNCTPTNVLAPLQQTLDRARQRVIPVEGRGIMPKVINIPSTTLPRQEPKHFVCLTIGSRGDVQPYIALGLGLQKEGHTVTIVTHEEYKEWVEGWGIRHRTAGGDPGALMKLSVEHKMFSPQFFKESLANFRKWLDELLVDAWEQCKDADILLESPSAMAGVHIAEALGIPYFRTFTMPWTKTGSFPHAFLSAPVDSPSFNASTYILFDNVFWTAMSGQVNRWRRNTLKIANTDMGHLAQSKIPFIYNFSTAVVPKPMDWGDATIISGYWFLDNPDLNWTPPETLIAWMAKAREDKKPIVYIGFGSVTVPNPAAMTRSIVKAVLKSDVRAIVSKGWSARMKKGDEPEFEFPPECYPLDKVPHDWLFPQIDAALHHGGAGTTGASLRAGIPTLIKPWFGDQYFWASRVQRLGAGVKVTSLRSADLASALTKATTDRIMKERAAGIGQKIRKEDGVHTAIAAIYTYLARAGRDRTEL